MDRILRKELIERLDIVNKKLNFVGIRGAMYLTDENLCMMILELERGVI